MAGGRKPKLSVVHMDGRKRPWLVNVPASLSDTGVRKREFFETKRQAETRIRELGKVESRESSRSELSSALEPYGATLWEAVNFFRMMHDRFQPALDEYGATMEEAIRHFLKHQSRRAASKEFCEVFAEFKAGILEHEKDFRLRGLPPRWYDHLMRQVSAFSATLPTASGAR